MRLRTSKLAAQWGCRCALLLSAACGVREYPHDARPPHADSANDFGPSTSSEQGQKDASGAYAGKLDGAAADAESGASPASADAAFDEGGAGTEMGARGEIELGGAQLRKEDVLAFIHFGHSNMAGYGVDPPALRPYDFAETDPRAWMYRAGTRPQLALEPTARTDHDQTGGPGLSLLKQAAQRAPNKYFVSLGYGVVSANCSQFLPGSLYFDAMSRSVLAITGHVTFAAIVVMLGNTEIHGSDADREAFPDCLRTIVDALRAAVGQPELPLLISGYEMEGTGMYARDGELAQKIIPMLARVPDVVSNSALVPADGLSMQDDHHFDLEGHMIWTRRLLDIMQAKGWAPWMSGMFQ